MFVKIKKKVKVVLSVLSGLWLVSACVKLDSRSSYRVLAIWSALLREAATAVAEMT